MHFPIIQLCSRPEDIGLGVNQMHNDSVINQYTDYIGVKYSKEERDELIRSGWFSNFFRGIGTIDFENGTVTLFSKDKIESTLRNYYSEVIERLSDVDMSQRVDMLFYALRKYGTRYKDNDMLIWHDSFASTSMGFIEDTPFNAGETLYIGDIYDAHF